MRTSFLVPSIVLSLVAGCATEQSPAPSHEGTNALAPHDGLASLSGVYTYSSISAGSAHSCLAWLTIATGTTQVRCWGQNSSGEVGSGSQSASILVPTPVSAPVGLVKVAAGTRHSCGLAANGDAYCWGANDYGQLGHGNSAPSRVAVKVVGGLKFTSLAIGRDHSCGLTAAGVAYCWGRGGEGQLGTGATSNALQPGAVQTPAVWTQLSAGSFHTCAVRRVSGEVYCWGDNAFGQLGTGDFNRGVLPRKPNLGNGYIYVTAGGYHTCVLFSNGLAVCFGRDTYGEVGSNQGIRVPNQEKSEKNPVSVKGGIQYSKISAGLNHTCGIRASDGVAFCWGRGLEGQLGNGSFSVYHLEPIAVSTTARFTDISAGGDHTLSISTMTSAESWGTNSVGQLGNGTTSSSATAVTTLP